MHLCSEPVSAARVDAWLAGAQVACRRFDCPYAFCAALSRGELAPPQLVLVGTDLLDESELGVVTYVRQCWPEAAVVVYGRRCGPGCGGPVLWLDSPAALYAALRQDPAVVAQSARRSAAAGRVLEVSSRPQSEIARPDLPRAESARPQVASPRAEPADSETGTEPPDPIISGSGLRSVLTPEELAALLEGPPRED